MLTSSPGWEQSLMTQAVSHIYQNSAAISVTFVLFFFSPRFYNFLTVCPPGNEEGDRPSDR